MMRMIRDDEIIRHVNLVERAETYAGNISGSANGAPFRSCSLLRRFSISASSDVFSLYA